MISAHMLVTLNNSYGGDCYGPKAEAQGTSVHGCEFNIFAFSI